MMIWKLAVLFFLFKILETKELTCTNESCYKEVDDKLKALNRNFDSILSHSIENPLINKLEKLIEEWNVKINLYNELQVNGYKNYASIKDKEGEINQALIVVDKLGAIMKMLKEMQEVNGICKPARDDLEKLKSETSFMDNFEDVLKNKPISGISEEMQKLKDIIEFSKKLKQVHTETEKTGIESVKIQKLLNEIDFPRNLHNDKTEKILLKLIQDLLDQKQQIYFLFEEFLKQIKDQLSSIEKHLIEVKEKYAKILDDLKKYNMDLESAIKKTGLKYNKNLKTEVGQTKKIVRNFLKSILYVHENLKEGLEDKEFQAWLKKEIIKKEMIKKAKELYIKAEEQLKELKEFWERIKDINCTTKTIIEPL